MPHTRRLRQEFLTGSALQSLKQHDYDTAARYLRIAVRMNPLGDTYLNAPMKAALYMLAVTGLLRHAHKIYERFQH
jgi:hypothetical protein